MSTAELQQLQQDHTVMREKVHELKTALNGGSSRLSLGGVRIQREAKQLCAALSTQLSAHIRHEARLATRSSLALGRMGPDALARLALEHHLDQEGLHIVNRSLARESRGWVTHVGPLLLSLIARLKRQMDAQEADLFPFMERALAANGHSNGAIRMKEGGDENGTDRDGGAAGGGDQRVRIGAGG